MPPSRSKEDIFMLDFLVKRKSSSLWLIVCLNWQACSSACSQVCICGLMVEDAGYCIAIPYSDTKHAVTLLSHTLYQQYQLTFSSIV